MRIFVGPTEIAGIGEGLSHGFAELGHECDVVTAQPHPFAYGTAQSKPWFAVIWLQLNGRALGAGPKTSVRGFFWRVVRVLWSWVVLLASLYRYDAFIFLSGSTITNTEFELWLLRGLKKRIIFTYVGSDARPAYMDGALSAGADASTKQIYQMVKRQKKLIAMHERYANEIVSAHSICHFSSRRLVNWFEIGLPRLNTSRGKQARGEVEAEIITALHSPSNSRIKGTEVILAAVENLKAKGVKIQLVTLQGVPNHEVVSALGKCDFVIDQLYSDTPMAGFATEAAHHGKPSVVGGYFAEEMHHYLRSEVIPPSEFVHPDRIQNAIEMLATDHEYRRALGERAQRYVSERWSARKVAERYLLLLTGEGPKEWYFDPSCIRYAGGLGLSRQESGNCIRALTKWGGSSALAVDSKPVLKARLLAWASSAPN